MASASALLTDVRGTLTKKKDYPPELDVLGQEPRIGIFVCHCGINIGGVVNVPEVVEFAKTLKGVAYAEENLYTSLWPPVHPERMNLCFRRPFERWA
jgi:hypothetical protein